jgi:magnesium and cobalt exporter, CNNM family
MILTLVILSLVLSAFFSGSEIAYVAANRLRVEVLARRGGIVGGLVTRFLSDPATLLTTTLVGNNLALVVYSTLFALLMDAPLQGFFATGLGLSGASLEVGVLTAQTVIASIIVLIVGEIIPKSLLRETANRAVFLLALPLRISYFLLLPMVMLARWSALLLMKFVKADAGAYSTFMRRDFELLLEESKLSGELDLDEDESMLLSNVFALGSIKVRESMLPRTDIVAVEESTSVADLLETFVSSGHSKIPVYHENIDNIVGVVFAYDLFDRPDTLKEVMREATFVPETKLSRDLLQDFLANETSIAIVIDEYGGTAGLVTSEDLLEELFGDIQDEFDNEDKVLRQIDADTVVVSGRVEIDELEEETGLRLREGDYETVAGYLLERLGTIPGIRDEVEIDGFRFTILQASSHRVDLVRVRRSSPAVSAETP